MGRGTAPLCLTLLPWRVGVIDSADVLPSYQQTVVHLMKGDVSEVLLVWPQDTTRSAGRRAASLTVSGKVCVFVECELLSGCSHLYQRNEFSLDSFPLGVSWEYTGRKWTDSASQVSTVDDATCAALSAALGQSEQHTL